ncbi:hypothetical protein BDA99DRAFT_517044 [Phascolomyces articulosus]|uniref:Uncharacterized protein n=1 Tax=Phascolomyces articulosus TaxID=60185 RepID=A0AAD5PDK3_9FUNG|nr:hypothetical protein BDA99DRAFT_517044 [Phascolomyces articulosus]
MWLNNSIFLLLFFYIRCCQSAKVLVDCTWPCADTTHACIVTNVTVQCGPQHNSQWILPQPNRSPIFIGETARRNTPCVTSPNPTLEETDLEDISNGRQSIIHWPPGNASNPLDDYLSDCEYNTYCSKETRICVNSKPEDAVCQSTHQCLNALQCIENDRCTDTSLDDDEDKAASDHHANRVHTAIIVVVVVVAALVIISVALFIYFYRKRKLKRINKHVSTDSTTISLPPLQHPPPPPSSALSPGVTHSSSSPSQQHASLSPNSSLEEQQQQPTVVMAQRSTETTPSMQQQHLQYQLHRQHASIDIKDNESTPNHIPPPPYSP